jgi:hypothetical protein
MSVIGAIPLVAAKLFIQNYPTITGAASGRRGEIGIFGTVG